MATRSPSFPALQESTLAPPGRVWPDRRDAGPPAPAGPGCQPLPGPGPFRARAKVLRASGLVALAVATVLPVFGGEHVLDDELFLQRHSVAIGAQPWWEAFRSPYLGGDPSAGGTAYYRPLALLLFRLEHEVAADSMLLAHATNAILHAVNTVLLWGLVAQKLAPGRAWLAAALFAVHPIHPESVAWVAGRIDVLALTFMLLALRLLRAAPWAAALAFLAAALSKETAILLPLVVLPVDAVLRAGTRGTAMRARLVRAAPLAATLVAYAILRLAALPRAGVEWTSDHLAAPSALGVLGTYVRLLVLPFPLGFQRAIEIDGTLLRPEFLPGYALLAGAAVLFVRRPEARPPLLWIFVFLLPVSGLFPVPLCEPGVWHFGERFLYIPSAGLAALAGAALPTTKLLWIPLLAAAAGLTAWHSAHFRSTGALVESSMRWFPGAASLWTTRADVAMVRSVTAVDAVASRTEAEAAVADLEHALSIRPGWYGARRTLAQALAAAGQSSRAEALFRELIAEDSGDPIPPNNLAFLLYRLGRREAARGCLLEALRRDPGFGPARANLAQLDGRR